MEEFKKIFSIENEFEAELLETIIKGKNIPFELICYHDSAFDGLFQYQAGWGHLEAPEEFAAELISIYEEIKKTAQDKESNEKT